MCYFWRYRIKRGIYFTITTDHCTSISQRPRGQRCCYHAGALAMVLLSFNLNTRVSLRYRIRHCAPRHRPPSAALQRALLPSRSLPRGTPGRPRPTPAPSDTGGRGGVLLCNPESSPHAASWDCLCAVAGPRPGAHGIALRCRGSGPRALAHGWGWLGSQRASGSCTPFVQTKRLFRRIF